MMVTVLRRLEGSGLLEREPSIMAYIERAEAYAAQADVYQASLNG